MPAIIDITGRVFSRLTVLSSAGQDKNHNSMWNCICTCGTQIVVQGNRLQRNHTRSCGCLLFDKNRDRLTTHGATRNDTSSPTYNTWVNMHQRCSNPNLPKWKNYGGRGITVCERWQDFAYFLADMGEKPEGKTIERVDNDAGYYPGNCVWADNRTQSRNKQDTIFITINGERRPLVAVCEEYGVSYQRAWERHKSGTRPLTPAVFEAMKRKAERKARKRS
jgi:hypothetical protein